MIFLAAISAGVIFAIVGIKRRLYSMWATMFNIMIAIYLGVMLTPTLATYFSMAGREYGDQSKPTFWYVYAAAVVATSFVTFIVLEVTAMTYFTGIFEITLPKLVNVLGSALAGFISGYILWGFLCFVVLIMPITSSRIILDSFTGNQESLATSKQVSIPAISKVVNTVNGFSFQPDMKKVKRVISWTLGWDVTPKTDKTNVDPENDTPQIPSDAKVES